MQIHGTTVIGIIKDGKCAIGSDGQVTIGQSVMKNNSRKVRKLYNDTVVAGFAGASADAFTLFERFEDKLQQYHGNLSRAAVELTKDWRLDKYLRRLEALLAVMNKDTALLISGNGDVVEPDDKIVAIGSGGNYALAAARVLIKHTDLTPREIVLESLDAASDICIYTNKNFSVEEI